MMSMHRSQFITGRERVSNATYASPTATKFFFGQEGDTNSFDAIPINYRQYDECDVRCQHIDLHVLQ